MNKTIALVNALDAEFVRKGCNYGVYMDGMDKIVVEVNWGDWKHDHIYASLVAKSFLNGAGYDVVEENEEVTEEDGSDCYSSIHTFRIR